jgi:hypothetical protein
MIRCSVLPMHEDFSSRSMRGKLPIASCTRNSGRWLTSSHTRQRYSPNLEWAADEVLADLRGRFEQYEVRATFFVANAGSKHPSGADYFATQSFYHDYERLLAARRNGKGARTLLLELLEAVQRNDLPTATVGEVNAHWRTVAKWT